MSILLLTEEAPLDPGRTATGNQVRTHGLVRTLEAAGLEVVHRTVSEPDRERVAAMLEEIRPDVLLTGYWKLLELLPDDCGMPVVADCVAPRPLEEHFVNPGGSKLYISQYVRALERADLIMVGNRRQRWMLAGWLLAGGLDLTGQAPVIEVPLGVRPRDAARTDHKQPLVATGGGQDWPWRRAAGWLDEVAAATDSDRVQLHLFGTGNSNADSIRRHELQPWGQWREFLHTHAHVGLELSDHNLERELSQSFRATAFVEAGLPLVLNRFLPLAELVDEYQAGWLVDTPEQAAEVLHAAAEDPELWRQRAAGAARLGRERLDLESTVAPLVDWLREPRRRKRVQSGLSSLSHSVERRPSLIGMASRALLAPLRRQVKGDGVVVVTRSDLFPTDHGAAVKIVETAHGLARLGRPVAIVTAETGTYLRVGPDSIERRKLPRWLRWLAPPRFLVRWLHRRRGLPESNAFLYCALVDPAYGLRAAWVGRQIGARVCLAEFTAYAQAARLCRLLNGGEAVLVEHNVEYQRLADQVETLTPEQFERLREVEIGLANCMNAVITVSEPDRRQLVADGADPEVISTIPHGVNLNAFDQAAPQLLAAEFGLDPERPVLVFHGTFSYPPNREALTLLGDEILPRLERLGHRAQVLAIGSRPPVGKGHPDIHLTGSLPHLAPALKACGLAVVPLISGGGTRMKILDYFAAGLPVVATSKGCEGLPVSNGRELLIRDDWDAFASAVAELLDDDHRREQVGATGRAMAENLSWDAIAQRYDDLFRRLEAEAEVSAT